MSKFKVGDKVRYIGSSTVGLWDGEMVVSKVEVNSDKYTCTHPSNGSCNFWSVELQLSCNEETELERLVRVANVGLDAMDTMVKAHSTEVEWNSGFKFPDVCNWNRIRIKPLLAFQPFYVGPNKRTACTESCTESCRQDDEHKAWKVELRQGRLLIGCRDFDIKETYNLLTKLCVERRPWFDNYNATRDGISKVDSEDKISWQDADKIRAALEKYFNVGSK